jgi:hypothetical protein
VVEAQAMDQEGAAVVANKQAALVAQVLHHLDHVLGHM